MISQKMINWGSQGCGIREIAAYGEARAAVVGAENVFNFTIGNPSVKGAGLRGAEHGTCWIPCPPEVLHGYTPAPGFYAVRQAMAEQLTKSFRTPYRAEDIFMTSGACAALAIICAALIGPGEEAVTLTPYFSEYRVYVEAVGGRLVEAPSDPETFQIDLAAVEEALSPRTALVLLNSPNNPSGVVLERSGWKRWRRCCAGRQRNTDTRSTSWPTSRTAHWSTAAWKSRLFRISMPTRSTARRSASRSRSRASAWAIWPWRSRSRSTTGCWPRSRARAVCWGISTCSSMYQLVAAECAGETADLSIYEANRDYLYRR